MIAALLSYLNIEVIVMSMSLIEDIFFVKAVMNLLQVVAVSNVIPIMFMPYVTAQNFVVTNRN